MKDKRLWASIRKDKDALRKATASKSFSEKLGILERLRERDANMRKARVVEPTRSPRE
jgi:hypothetical protein